MRVERAILLLIGVGFGTIALAMLTLPLAWYERFPDVSKSGPFNAHLVRDLGAAFIVSGAGLALAALHPKRYLLLAYSGTALLGLHALIHAAETLLPGSHADSILALGTVYAPAVVAAGATFLAARSAGFDEHARGG